MIFATDLDRTLIYSIRQVKDTAGLVPVEYKNEQPLSYMSNEAVELFQKLKENPDLIIIPVTARSTEQFRRIQVVQDCPYAILACGAVILKGGKPLPIWQQFVKQIRTSEKENYAFFEKFFKAERFFKKNANLFVIQPRMVDDAVIFFKLRSDNAADEFLNRLQQEVSDKNWNYIKQGLKVYLSPKLISKQFALQIILSYLKEAKGEKNIIAAGDGAGDIDFMSLANITRFVPAESEAYEIVKDSHFAAVVPSGTNGTYELLKNVQHLTKAQETIRITGGNEDNEIL